MPVDTGYFERQRRGITDDYTSRAATNAYGRFLSQQRGERGIADYQRDWTRAAPKFSAQYGQRGMAGSGVKSGVYQKAMRNFVGDYSQNVNRMYADQANEMRQYDLTAAEQTAAKDRALSDLEMSKQQEIANAALYLNALKPQFQ